MEKYQLAWSCPASDSRRQKSLNEDASRKSQMKSI